MSEDPQQSQKSDTPTPELKKLRPRDWLVLAGGVAIALYLGVSCVQAFEAGGKVNACIDREVGRLNREMTRSDAYRITQDCHDRY
jgi:hypothetical protein